MSATARPKVEQLTYSPASPYPYDLEVFRLSDLKRRSTVQAMRRTYCYEFYMLICVTEGQCTHFVDFEPVECSAGTLLTLRPGQAHNFGSEEDWDGWMVLLRPEFLLSAEAAPTGAEISPLLNCLPGSVCLDPVELRRAMQDIQCIHDDARLKLPGRPDEQPGIEAADVSASCLSVEVHVLLRYRFYALLTWLALLHGQRQEPVSQQSAMLLRFRQFEKLVDERFSQWSQVGDYANYLGCTEKSLTRATLAVQGVSAKAYLSKRIVLEAKRLLLHTDLPIGALSGRLGFGEVDRFCKFFKRETSFTPKDFRKSVATP
ncbi:HTH-type transcriptional activator RhaS [Dickeya dianthicola]|uniref:AraC family transcriptional regulator n=2 Tax=Dickeya dianthicola TaxID=204039 RepID=A0AAP2D002_9GAMM|nr:AraC family transcriptional regulator [Dickeya dianthicola]ATO32341.1 Transcriptional regulator, AraC family [Dickeya dianthicola RNS04.9]AYC18329.1 HTH-type transcriptional activator RhaS [Dickeya dianthicola]MBI0439883.1 helix-turn-helix domain-containing protein [Dickeya dianthicola]MBI0450608.1 helix-turn-helix domain-containing protein [Dickeya dianthicola]MBI0455197.1 helix-turn-helix domain-containing protein [Dickeya dianthicola]